MWLNFLIDSFLSVFEKGGVILFFIFIQFLVMWYLSLRKYLYFKNEFDQDFDDFKNDIKSIANDNIPYKSSLAQKRFSIFNEVINSKISWINLFVMLCPLFGLLGTVTGMVSVFDVLAVAGSGNARAMASGISKATIPTMAGMIGALTGLLFLNYLKNIIKVKKKTIQDFMSNWILEMNAKN